MSSFLGVPVDAAYHLVAGLTGILTPVLGGLAAVAAIVVFTMAVRLLLMPLRLRALRGQAARLGRLMAAQASAARPARPAKSATPDKPATGAAASPGLLVRVLPYLTVVIAAFAPLAAGIYLLTTLAWSLAERMLYARK